MTIFEALREDHDKQRTLIDVLTATHGDSNGREEVFARLKQQLQAHAGAEERYFYRPLMDHDLTQDKARHSIAEHKQIDDLVETLQDTDFSSSAWLTKAKDLAHLVTHHLDEEEQEVFQLAGKALSENEKSALATQYRRDMSERLEN